MIPQIREFRSSQAWSTRAVRIQVSTRGKLEGLCVHTVAKDSHKRKNDKRKTIVKLEVQFEYHRL